MSALPQTAAERLFPKIGQRTTETSLPAPGWVNSKRHWREKEAGRGERLVSGTYTRGSRGWGFKLSTNVRHPPLSSFLFVNFSPFKLDFKFLFYLFMLMAAGSRVTLPGVFRSGCQGKREERSEIREQCRDSS